MSKFRVFSLQGLTENDPGQYQIITDALDQSEVIFYELHPEENRVYICNCDHCEHAARDALAACGISLMLINDTF